MNHLSREALVVLWLADALDTLRILGLIDGPSTLTEAGRNALDRYGREKIQPTDEEVAVATRAYCEDTDGENLENLRLLVRNYRDDPDGTISRCQERREETP